MPGLFKLGQDQTKSSYKSCHKCRSVEVDLLGDRNLHNKCVTESHSDAGLYFYGNNMVTHLLDPSRQRNDTASFALTILAPVVRLSRTGWSRNLQEPQQQVNPTDLGTHRLSRGMIEGGSIYGKLKIACGTPVVASIDTHNGIPGGSIFAKTVKVILGNSEELPGQFTGRPNYTLPLSPSHMHPCLENTIPTGGRALNAVCTFKLPASRTAANI